MNAISETEYELAAIANDKKARGVKINREEMSALRKVKTEFDTRGRFAMYVAVPQKDFVAMTGKRKQQVYDQVELYEMPEIGATVNLPEFIGWLFEFVSKHAWIFRQAREGAVTFGGPETDSLELVRAETHQLLKLKRLKEEGKLADVELIREQMAPLVARLRECGEQLRRAYGDEAQAILNEAIDDVEAHTKEALGETDKGEDDE